MRRKLANFAYLVTKKKTRVEPVDADEHISLSCQVILVILDNYSG